ncbi:MAG: type ISP restriction/modification enzyme [Candidatus Bathyarchaeia archaeon]
MKLEEFFSFIDRLSAQEKGEFFERFIKQYLLQSPEYSRQFVKVERWREYEDRGRRVDTGVDLVAFDIEGRRWAVQAKYHKNIVGLEDTATFFASLGTKEFDGGILVVKEGINERVEEKIDKFEKPILILTLRDLLEDIKEIKETGEIYFEEVKKELRPYQKSAVQSVIEGFKEADRGKLIMPPGSGKTFTALRIAEELLKDGGIVLFLCPSISLLDQSLRSWLRDARKEIKPLAVVSDTSVGRQEDSLDRLSVLSFPPTTSPEELLENFKHIKENLKGDELVVIFSTYQSLDVVELAQRQGLPEIDLVICDEAHRTTGVVEEGNSDLSNFRKVHHNEYIKAKKRLYMTATPKVYKTEIESGDFTVYSMDDERIYGRTFYEYTFRRAVEEGYLSDFKVLVFGVSDREVQERLFGFVSRGHLNLEDTSKLYGLMKVLEDGFIEDGQKRTVDIKKGIVFVNTVRDSKRLQKHYKDLKDSLLRSQDELDQRIGNMDLEIRHIDGSTPAIERKRLLSWLGEDAYQKRFLINAKVLTEGIDVPALDLIAFFRPKKSVVDVIQAVGRVMRKAKGKSYGYILVPVIVDEKEEIKNEDYKTVVQILDALRSVDETYSAVIRIKGKSLMREDTLLGITTRRETDRYELTEERLLFALPHKVAKSLMGKTLRRFGLGNKYLENWAEDVSKSAKVLKDHIEIAIRQDQRAREEFSSFLKTLRTYINEDIEQEQAISMLVQYMLTKPIFSALFGDHKDLVSQALDKVASGFENFLESITEKLQEFYKKVKVRAMGLVDEEERQDFLRHLYDNFFRKAFKDTAEQLGIAYTPVEIVDFMIRISDDLIKREFGRQEGINSEDVIVLEPFAGTGTFLVRLLEYLEEDSLKDKYRNGKLWANEILLLPYYIAKINTELTYRRRTGTAEEFKTILLTDSFAMMEKIYESKPYTTGLLFPEEYSELLNAQKKSKINLILSNPPYFSRAESGNTRLVRGRYKLLREKVKQTFAKYITDAKLRNSLYDSYIYAIRMGLDRVEEGVIAYVANNGWLDSSVGQGLRKVLEKELDKVYIVDLRGNLRKGDKAEGENVFDVKVGVCVVFMVKKKNKSKRADIYYHDIGGGLSKGEKLQRLKEFKTLEDIPFEKIEPNDKGDWFNQRGVEFYNYPAMAEDTTAIFDLTSWGLSTSRDAYAWNLSKDKLRQYMERLIQTFNDHVERFKRGEITKEDLNNKTNIETDERKIKWDRELLKEVKKGKTYTFATGGQVYEGLYRPFVKQYAYFSKVFNNQTYQLPKIFPYPDAENLVIVISYKANSFSVLMVNRLYDLHLLEGGSFGFPLYVYGQAYGKEEKRINITSYALREYKKRYGDDITEEDIFYYVFGILNHPDYQERFRNELLKEIPRIPFVEDRERFERITFL